MADTPTIKRGFNRKHLIVMALGNIIGSGIFLASGTAISLAGPAAVLAYVIGGIIMVMEVMFIAEMSIINPAPGSFRVHATEIFGPGLGFVNGWMFWCSGVLGMAGEVTAAAIYISFWLPTVPPWVFCLLFAIIMTVINFLDVRGLSRFEAWLASVKIITLAAFVLFGTLAVLHIIPVELQGKAAGFSSAGAFMPHGIKGIMASMLMVLFSFTGTGIIGLTIADAEDPEKEVPPAINSICFAVISLYVLTILLIVLLVPWNTLSSDQSPFVTILNNLRIPFGATVITFIVLTASLSGLNSAMYSASRMLFSLSRDKQAPGIFLKTNKNGVPVYAVGVGSAVLVLTAVVSYLLPQNLFIILTGASGFLAMFNWLTISVTHYFYRKKVLREKPEKLKYKVPAYPFITILAIVLIAGIIATSYLYPGQIASLITGIAIIAVLIPAYWVFRKVKALK